MDCLWKVKKHLLSHPIYSPAVFDDEYLVPALMIVDQYGSGCKLD